MVEEEEKNRQQEQYRNRAATGHGCAWRGKSRRVIKVNKSKGIGKEQGERDVGGWVGGVQTAPYTEKRHVTQRREKQKTTGEKKKGKGLISGATSAAQGQFMATGTYSVHKECIRMRLCVFWEHGNTGWEEFWVNSLDFFFLYLIQCLFNRIKGINSTLFSHYAKTTQVKCFGWESDAGKCEGSAGGQE